MLKNKKGFTLIELLVAIAIMISITVVAIISITKISEQNKKQAYELVKDQVKTAALEYFSANEYLFEGLENGSDGKITVEKLIESGYLNSVVNPITGKKLNGCDYVKVKKEENSYSYSFDSVDNGICEFDKSIVIAEPKSTPGTILYYDSNNTRVHNINWFNIQKLGENGSLKVCLKPDSDEPLLQVIVAGQEINTKEELGYCKNIIEDGVYENVDFKIINKFDKSWSTTDDFKKDTERPSGNIEITSTENNYNSNIVNIVFNVGDSTSDVKEIEQSYGTLNNNKELNNYQITDKLSGNSMTLSAEVIDNAENKGQIFGNYEVYQDCSNKIVDGYQTSDTGCSKRCGGGTNTITKTEKMVDQYTQNACGFGERTIENPTCNNQSCCDSNVGSNVYKNTTYGSWSTCGGSCNGKQTRTITKNYVSQYDSNISCGTITSTDSQPCNVGTKPTLTLDRKSTEETVSEKDNGKKVFWLNGGRGCWNYKPVSERPLGCCTALNNNNNNTVCANPDNYCSTSNNAYIGQACKNVGDYKRYFTVTQGDTTKSVYSVGERKYEGDYCPENTECIQTRLEEWKGTVIAWNTIARKECFDNNSKDTPFNKYCGKKFNKGDGGQQDFTSWHFKFVADCGGESNEIILYTKYSGNCEYQ